MKASTWTRVYERLADRRVSACLAAGTVVGLDLLDGYEHHWWYDNLSHFLAGYAIGVYLSREGAAGDPDHRTVCTRFVAITSAWECFEYLIGERPWDGSMVWDHACEDTVLDTVMGTVGAYVAVVAHR